MAFIQWRPDFETGIAQIDREHKKLVGLVNELYDAMKAGAGNQALGKVLTGLTAYTKTHFATEEKLMSQHAYPAFLAHKAEHDKLTAQVVELGEKFQAGNPVLTVQVANFLKEWLSKHILSTDQKYAPFLRSKGVS
ncbi:MAG: bacteriohemerythrin [Deltaproteobacteria bacterium]|nr:bacteriohemerythrin [Deltaproteobacteria bacterium]